MIEIGVIFIIIFVIVFGLAKLLSDRLEDKEFKLRPPFKEDKENEQK